MSKGANLNDIDNDGDSPIIYASRGGHVDVVELLLSRGADIPNIIPYYRPVIKNMLNKWHIYMAIIALRELSLYYYLDASTIIDLYQYIRDIEEEEEEENEEDSDDEEYHMW